MKRIILFVCLAAVLAGCATGGVSKTVRYPNAVTPEIQQSFNEADSLYRDRRFSEANVAFEKFITQSPYTELTDEARFRRGEIAFVKKDYNAALGFYRESISDIVSPSIAPKALF